jgi:hypothetical protein
MHPQGRSGAGRIRSIEKNAITSLGIELDTFSIELQPTTLLNAYNNYKLLSITKKTLYDFQKNPVLRNP